MSETAATTSSFICSHVADRSLLAHVDEVHHIDPFVTSLNNDASNLVVLCPSRHRIVHATHAQFRRAAKSVEWERGA